VPRLFLDRHAAVAALAAALAFAGAPSLAGEAAGVEATAGSVTARAASTDSRPAAERFPVDGPSVQGAVRIANEFWGRPACGGRVELRYAALERQVNATAAWSNPTDAWANADANFDCRITINSGAQFDWPKLCSVIAHEMGHLVGQAHIERDGELMSALYSGPLGVCARTPDPAGPAPAPAARAATADRTAQSAPRTRRSSNRSRPFRRRLRCTAARRRAGRCRRTHRKRHLAGRRYGDGVLRLAYRR
jgi:hypothetical protein